MSTSKNIIYLITAVLLTAGVLRVFVFDSFTVAGNSMSPTIRDGDYVFVNKLAYLGDKEPQREDVVVGNFREMAGKKVIKRVVGLPREWVEVKNGQVYIKESRSGNSTVVRELYNVRDEDIDNEPYRLDPHEYYLVGDNDRLSSDSRNYGPVDTYRIDGQVILRFRMSDGSMEVF